MSNTQAIIIALFVSGLLAVMLLIFLKIAYLFSNRTEQGQKRRYKIKQIRTHLLLWVYKALSRLFFTRSILQNLSIQVKHMYVMETEDSKLKATEIICKTVGIAALAFLISLVYFDDTLLAAAMTYMIGAYAFHKLKGDGQKFLIELEETIDDMVHMYNAERKNIDRMFFRLLEDRKGYMHKYIDQMYTYLRKALLDTDNKMIITEYNNSVPSRHLRLLFNYIYLTYRFGDAVDDSGEELFSKNLLAIQREVHNDSVKMQRIKDATFGEEWFIIGALLMIPAATWYMRTFFTFDGLESIETFLKSSQAYTVKVVCAIVTLACFFVYTRLMYANNALESAKTVHWEETLIYKFGWLKALIDFLAPKEGTKRRSKLENDLSISRSNAGIRTLYFRKLIISLSVLVIVGTMVSIDTYSNYKVIANDIYTGVNAELMDTIIKIEGEFSEEQYKAESIANDQLVIDLLNKNKSAYYANETAEDRQSYIVEVIELNSIDYGAYPEIAAARIASKYEQIGNISPLIIFLIIISSAIVAYNIPNMLMTLQVWFNRGAMIYDEVIGYYTVVILLCRYPSSNIQQIFQWLTSFAQIFKTRFQSCLDNLSSKEIRALEKDIKFKPLSRLVESLIIAYEGVDLQSAFAGIEQRQLFQEETRHLLNEKIISKRVSMSRAFSWIALGTTFGLYIVYPLILAMVDMVLQVF